MDGMDVSHQQHWSHGKIKLRNIAVNLTAEIHSSRFSAFRSTTFPLSSTQSYAAALTFACALRTSNRACNRFCQYSFGHVVAQRLSHVRKDKVRPADIYESILWDLRTCFCSFITLNLSKSVNARRFSRCDLRFAHELFSHCDSISFFSHALATAPRPAHRGNFGMTMSVRLRLPRAAE